MKKKKKNANNYLNKKGYEDWKSQGGIEKDVEDCQFPIDSPSVTIVIV